MTRSAAILFFLACIASANATTLYRLPLAYIPYPITAWKDNSAPSSAADIRYDNTNIPSNSIYYYDAHMGTDFGVPYGKPVYAAATGTVYGYVDYCDPDGGGSEVTCGGGFGNYVALMHPDGVISIYAHLSSVAVRTGTVYCTNGPEGTLIGVSGFSGQATGPHLHFELRLNNLNVSSPKDDPFGGVASTQSRDLWYDWALVSDPLHPGATMHYPTTECQPG